MKRERKGAVVEVYIHPKTKREAKIRLEKGSMIFHTTIESAAGVPESFESKDGRAVRVWLQEQLIYSTAEFVLDWKPVIEVETGDGSGGRWERKNQGSEGIRITIARYFLALTPNKTEWRKLLWELGDEESPAVLPANERYAQSERFRDGPEFKGPPTGWNDAKKKPFRLPYFEDGRDDGTSYLLYTPDTWAGLEEVLATIRAARTAITQMCGSKAGLVLLAEVGAGTVPLRLTAGAERGRR